MKAKMEEVSKRIRKCANLVGSGDELSRQTHIARRTLENYFIGRSEPSISKISTIANAAGVSLEWLIDGHGEMLRHDMVRNKEGFISIPFYDAHLAAGAGSFNENVDIISNVSVDKTYLTTLAGKDNTKDLVFLEVRGNSMLPTIASGDIALVDLKEKNIHEDIMAFVFEGDAYIKRIRKMFGGIDVISDNKEFYPAYNICKERMDQFYIIGKILSVSHLF